MYSSGAKPSGCIWSRHIRGFPLVPIPSPARLYYKPPSYQMPGLNLIQAPFFFFFHFHKTKIFLFLSSTLPSPT